VELGLFNVKKDELQVDFKINGKNENSKGYHAGIDAYKIHPKREFIPEWYLIGPFPNERESDILRYGLDSIFPPENEIDFSKTYAGAGGQKVKWQKVTTPGNGYFSLWDKFDPYEFVVSYAFTYVYCPVETFMPLFIGSDDGIKVFFNGAELHRFLDVRIAAPDQDEIILPLKKGWNELLLKIENNFGGYAFYARILDTDKKLQYSLSK